MAAPGKLMFLGGSPTTRATTPPVARWVLSGVTRDASSAVLPGCTVDVFELGTRMFRGTTVSDANGLYSIDVTQPPLQFFCACYLAGSPNVGGLTDFVLTGVPG